MNVTDMFHHCNDPDGKIDVQYRTEQNRTEQNRTPSLTPVPVTRP
ncbi:hypothetical protein AVEN_186492-1, partial [Araneus ventricosus]